MMPVDLHGATLFNDNNHSGLLLPTDSHVFMLSNDGSVYTGLASSDPKP